jgi:hypothetical protein
MIQRRSPYKLLGIRNNHFLGKSILSIMVDHGKVYMELDRFKHSTHEQIKKWIVAALKETESHSCQQQNLVKRICSLKGISTLRGQPRKDFEHKVNKAIGAMKRSGQLATTKNSPTVRLVSPR